MGRALQRVRGGRAGRSMSGPSVSHNRTARTPPRGSAITVAWSQHSIGPVRRQAVEGSNHVDTGPQRIEAGSMRHRTPCRFTRTWLTWKIQLVENFLELRVLTHSIGNEIGLEIHHVGRPLIECALVPDECVRLVSNS